MIASLPISYEILRGNAFHFIHFLLVFLYLSISRKMNHIKNELTLFINNFNLVCLWLFLGMSWIVYKQIQVHTNVQGWVWSQNMSKCRPNNIEMRPPIYRGLRRKNTNNLQSLWRKQTRGFLYRWRKRSDCTPFRPIRVWTSVGNQNVNQTYEECTWRRG